MRKLSLVFAAAVLFTAGNVFANDSKTETFFKATFTSNLAEQKNRRFEFIAGKALSKKEVFIELETPNHETQRIEIQPCSGGAISLPEADGMSYHRLISDFLANDQSHFVSLDEVEAQWRVTEGLLNSIHINEKTFYEIGSVWVNI